MASKKKGIQSDSNQIPLPLTDAAASELERRFQIFHEANPKVWKYFVQFAFEAINAGRTYLGGRLIAERIRWECSVVTVSEDEFKLNDHHTPYYVRKFRKEYPQYANFFRVREVVGDRERDVRTD